MLLGAVVQVALDGAPLRVAGFDDAGAGGAELVGLAPNLVERLLQRRVELHVVQRQPDLARELGERLVVGLAELQCALGRRATIMPSSSPELVIGAMRSTSSSSPDRIAGSQMRAHAAPDTPARAITDSSSEPSTS